MCLCDPPKKQIVVIGELSSMIGSTRSRIYPCLLYTYIVALFLAVAWPAAVAAQIVAPPPGPPPATSPTPKPTPPPGPPATSTPRPTAVPTAVPTAAPTSSPGNGDTSKPPTTPTPTTGSGTTPTLDQVLAEYELIKALAPNRIIFHAATPIQLCKSEDGLQVYYIGRNGKTRLGPYVPSFAELAAKYPDGDEVSIYLGYNPLSGKRVKIDYLPSVKRVRVDTFYSDKDNDKNKQYIFHFGPEHDITYDVW